MLWLWLRKVALWQLINLLVESLWTGVSRFNVPFCGWLTLLDLWSLEVGHLSVLALYIILHHSHNSSLSKNINSVVLIWTKLHCTTVPTSRNASPLFKVQTHLKGCWLDYNYNYQSLCGQTRNTASLLHLTDTFLPRAYQWVELDLWLAVTSSSFVTLKGMKKYSIFREINLAVNQHFERCVWLKISPYM